MDNKQQGDRMQCGGAKTIMPHSSTDSSRETQKKYMKPITKLKNTTTPPMCITFIETVASEENNRKLSRDHPFRFNKYIFEYIKKGTPHVKIVLNEQDIQPENYK